MFLKKAQVTRKVNLHVLFFTYYVSKSAGNPLQYCYEIDKACVSVFLNG